MKRRLLACVAGAVVALGAVGTALGITNGQPDGTAHPNVGVMVIDTGGGPKRLCSGELITATQFLTAAHCTAFLVGNLSVLDGVSFDSVYDPATSTVVPAVAVTVDPLFGKDHADLHDLGVITLAVPMSATPVTLPTAGLLDRLDAQNGLRDRDFLNVGYGATGIAVGGGPQTLIDFRPIATRRVSTSPFAALEDNVLRLQGNTNATGEGGTCVGDSGSARYLDVGGTDVAVAIRSTGGDAHCTATEPNYRLDTPSARAFLAQFVTLP